MDKHSKRNKSKDNPYTLNYDDVKHVYLVEFIDSMKIKRVVEISDDVYKAFDEFELEDISQIHKFRKHIERNEVYEESLYHRASNSSISLEDQVENKLLNDELRKAINKLPEIQKRRIIKYYFDGKNEYEIATEENTTQQAVNKSLKVAKDKLKEILKKFKF